MFPSPRRALTHTTLAAASAEKTNPDDLRPIQTANSKTSPSSENKDHPEMVTGKTERPVMVETMTTKRLGLVFIVTAHMVFNGKTLLISIQLFLW